MPFALLIIGLLLVIASVRNTQGDLINLVAADFSGPGNFVYWIVALLIIGAIGYVQKLKPLSDGFLVLVLLVLVLKKGNPKFNTQGGFFQQFTDALKSTQAQVTPTAQGNIPGALSYTGNSSGVGVDVGPGGVTIGGPGGSIGISLPKPPIIGGGGVIYG